MALRIENIVEYGQLNNTKKNSTFGWLRLRGSEMDHYIELTGDMSPDLRGKRISFSPNPEVPVYTTAADEAISHKSIHPHQIGSTGDMTAADWVKLVDCPVDELINRAKSGEMPPSRYVRRLYLEWFSQNGRVVIELADPLLEEYVGEENGEEKWVPMEPLTGKPDDDFDAMEKDDLAAEVREQIPFGQDYKAGRRDGSLNIRQLTDPEAAEEFAEQVEHYRSLQPPPSNEDEAESDYNLEEDLLELNYMDDVVEGKYDDDPLLASVLDIPEIDGLTDTQAEAKLKEVLGMLAMYGIAIHICEHFTAKDTLRIIRDDYGLESRIHPGFVGSGWVQNFNTGESCPKCDAEFEERWQRDNPEADPSDPPF